MSADPPPVLPALATARSPGSPVPVPAPVQERSLLPDVLRGLALLGILCVNMQEFAGYHEWQQVGLNRAAQVLIDVFANGRFISIFAMLFGWGAFGLLRHGRRLFFKRHLLLLLVGTAHHLLLWRGDIIGLYAALALALPLLARMQVRGLLTLAAVLGGWWLLSDLALLGTLGDWGNHARTGNLPSLAAGQSWAGVTAQRAAGFSDLYLGSLLYNMPWLLALFCLGAAAQKAEVLTHPERFGPLFRRLAALGWPLGLALGGCLAYLNTRPDEFSDVLAVPVRMAGGLAGALGYAGTLGLLAGQHRLGGWQQLAAAGRLSLTNYLTQSLVMTSVFYPYAGAQWGRWGAAACLALALNVGLLQVIFSRWWVARAGMGPAERALRWAVYGK